eukprot:scaffold682_cov363-Pavlova_lutheri.AAC.41
MEVLLPRRTTVPWYRCTRRSGLENVSMEQVRWMQTVEPVPNSGKGTVSLPSKTRPCASHGVRHHEDPRATPQAPGSVPPGSIPRTPSLDLVTLSRPMPNGWMHRTHERGAFVHDHASCCPRKRSCCQIRHPIHSQLPRKEDPVSIHPFPSDQPQQTGLWERDAHMDALDPEKGGVGATLTKPHMGMATLESKSPEKESGRFGRTRHGRTHTWKRFPLQWSTAIPK